MERVAGLFLSGPPCGRNGGEGSPATGLLPGNPNLLRAPL